MNKHILATALSAAALLETGIAAAAPFNSFDPRSMGMGGAGVAVGNAATAPFFNPSLLAITEHKDDFAKELPVFGPRGYDPNDLKASVEDYHDADLVGKIDADIAAAELTPANSAGYHQIAADATLLASDPNVGFRAVSDKPIQGEIGLGTVVGIPSKTFGAAFFYNTWAAFGGRAHYTTEDEQVLNDMAAEIEAYADCLDGDVTACPTTSNYVSATGDVTFDTTGLTSSVDIRGLMLSEVGISFAREFTIFGGAVALGITPKHVTARTFDYSADVDDMDAGDIQEEEYIHDQSNFNVDIGASRDFQNGWRSGIVVKNLISQEYDFVYTDPTTGVETKTGSMTLKPQVRTGLSYQTNWFTAALDMDLTENDPVGFEDKSRYVALGVELDAADWAQLRLGYRADTVNSERNVASAGLGLSPFGAHIDMSVAGNANEIGASFQLGFRF
jgi:hypothetical protein